jgi:hypothetical protein
VTPSITLLAACDDPKLLNFPIWPKQRELLADFETTRLNVWNLGRRSGKTEGMALAGAHRSVLCPELRRFLRPRERGYAVAIAPNLRQARRVIAETLGIVEASPVLRDCLIEATLDELVFVDDMAFAAFPCTSRGARGWPIHTLLLDEAAWFVADENESFQTAEQVWRALAPATAQFGDEARIVVSSTPSGPEGFFADLFGKVSRGEISNAVAHQATSAEANPMLDSEFLEAEKIRDPDGFALEYEARFVGGGRLFLDEADITAAIVDRAELPPDAAPTWVCGLDPSFSSDPFGLAIVGRDRMDPNRLLLALARAWTPARRKPRSLEEQRSVEDAVLAEVAEVCARYGGQAVTDQYKAAGVVDRLRRLGVSTRSIPMTEVTKTDAYRETRARLVARELELYPEPQLLSELRRIRSRFAAGRARVEIPRIGGSHGDIAQALALGVYSLRGLRSGNAYSPEANLDELLGLDALRYDTPL